MFKLVIRFTQYLICTISMVLTSLFALSFTEPSQTFSWPYFGQTSLLIATGISLDLSKYIFWYHKGKHIAFLTLSASLMFFSCLASVAFFVTQENRAVTSAQRTSADYLAHQALIAQTEKAIQYKEQLAEQRLDSRYHNQWDKGEALFNEIHALTQQYQTQLMTLDQKGIQGARANIASSAFFLRLSEALNVGYTSTVIIAYACLAVFIELCALGLISIPLRSPDPICPSKIDATTNDTTAEALNSHASQPRHQLIDAHQIDTGNDGHLQLSEVKKDILEGRVKPFVRQLMKHYNLRHKQVKSLLESMEEAGLIHKEGRVYVLTETTTPTQTS